MATMVVTIDKAGRIVVPKEVRDRLSFTADLQLELRIEGDSLVVFPQRARGRKVADIDGWPVIAPVTGMSISDADVQKWRNDGQR